MERSKDSNAMLLAAHFAVEANFAENRTETPLLYMTSRYTLASAVLLMEEDELLVAHGMVKLMRDHKINVSQSGFNHAVAYAKWLLDGRLAMLADSELPPGVERIVEVEKARGS